MTTYPTNRPSAFALQGQPTACSRTVVMKFGGSSVADPAGIARVARRLVAARQGGTRVVGVISAMGDTTDDLLALADRVSPNPTARELDMLLSVGEQIACALVAMAVCELGQRSISLTGPQAGILTDTAHGNAKIVDIRTLRIRAALARGQVVLVAGFQGLGGNEITTLGRGGSDATAVALAAALAATECEIYTDVEGVYSADPRSVPNAQKLEVVSYDEMLELAGVGAAVLQLRAVEIAQSHGVVLHVRSSFSDSPGTLIGNTDGDPLERPLISGVSHGPPEALFRVAGVENAELFAAIAAASINLDTILRLDGEIVLSTPIAKRTAAAHVLTQLEADWSDRVDLSRVSVVGGGMTSHPGIAADVFAAVAGLGHEARFISTSPVRISFYVPRAAAETIAQALHERLRVGARRKPLELSA